MTEPWSIAEYLDLVKAKLAEAEGYNDVKEIARVLRTCAATCLDKAYEAEAWLREHGY